MSSSILPRHNTPGNGTQSIYEAIREHDAVLEGSDNEDHAEIALDERNFEDRFEEQELDDLIREAADAENDPAANSASTLPLLRPAPDRRLQSRSRSRHRPRWQQQASDRPIRLEDDDDVPESLLLEEDRDLSPPTTRKEQAHLPQPVPGPQTGSGRPSRIHHGEVGPSASDRMHQLPANSGTTLPRIPANRHRAMLATREQMAQYRWASVEDLDNFLKQVYTYYMGNGFWSIQLARVLALLTSAFVVAFSTFLLACVDYSAIPRSKHLSEILIPDGTNNLSGLSNLLLWLFAFLWIAQAFQYVTDVRRLWHLHDFYLFLLGVPDKEVQTISWQELVGRVMTLRDANVITAVNKSAASRRVAPRQATQRMDAHDIANRLMRRENYLIALFNKDILDLTLPVPFLRERQWFTKTLELSIQFCVMDFVFNRKGEVSQLFLKDSHRKQLIEALRRRFAFAGCMTIIGAPFLVTYFLILYFLKYFTEFQRNPSELSSRAYTPLAEWKFREFNELQHLFRRRINMSRPFASRYVDQFPKDKTVQLATFLAFIAGALAAVLGVASLLDPENFFSFEITPDRTVIFYLSIFGGAWAIARGMVPSDDLVYDPEFAIRNVIDYTHYQPSHWKSQLHSDDVRKEFSALYQTKIVIFLEEMLSIFVTPFVLWFSLPKCSERLVDFFREFTIHVDGLGYVCSFAVFEFDKAGALGRTGQAGAGQGSGLRDDYYTTKDDKMLTSYYNFMDSYAHNPKGGGRFYGHGSHTVRRAHFNPPPAFPGLTGPPATGATRSATARTSATAQRMSPPASLLLDPRHQPSRSTMDARGLHTGASTGHRQTGSHSQSRHRGLHGHGTMHSQIHEQGIDEADERQPLPQHTTSSTILEEDSHLGASWQAFRHGDGADGDADEERRSDELVRSDGSGAVGALGRGGMYPYEDGAAGGVAGVLGLISKLAQGGDAAANI